MTNGERAEDRRAMAGEELFESLAHSSSSRSNGNASARS